jgi:hypothetical protein
MSNNIFVQMIKGKMPIESRKTHSPLLADLHSYDWLEHREVVCHYCKKKVLHEVYRGHTFAEGNLLMHCLNCFSKWMDIDDYLKKALKKQGKKTRAKKNKTSYNRSRGR